ncbi:hypothetical protein MRB53_005760 [Persea americana]|uniref:Uncharacterized protein n=1 Tax=Persea americana TaxID=3435 RepID=A0ACC2MFV9_PERAE|nr:hypothetical protein MRB53_005760 [Persea americana]
MHKKFGDENGKFGDGSSPDFQKQGFFRSSPFSPFRNSTSLILTRPKRNRVAAVAETQSLRLRLLLRSLLRNFFEKVRSGGPPQINADCYSRFSATKF